MVIFSVLMRSATGSNNGQLVLYQRYAVGNGSLGSSRLNGSGSFTAANDYTAANPNNDAEPARHQRAGGDRVGAGRDDLRHRGLHAPTTHRRRSATSALRHPGAEGALFDRVFLSARRQSL